MKLLLLTLGLLALCGQCGEDLNIGDGLPDQSGDGDEFGDEDRVTEPFDHEHTRFEQTSYLGPIAGATAGFAVALMATGSTIYIHKTRAAEPNKIAHDANLRQILARRGTILSFFADSEVDFEGDDQRAGREHDIVSQNEVMTAPRAQLFV